MKNVKSEELISLSKAVIAIWKSNALKKVILSKPDATDEIKSVITPKSISGVIVLQKETFSKDNKAYHYNISDDFENQLVTIFKSYSQINVLSTVGQGQYMKSKGGKETLIGISKIVNSLSSDIETVKVEGNNKKKRLREFEINQIVNIFLNKEQVEDLSSIVSYDEIINKNYSLVSMLQYKFKYNETIHGNVNSLLCI